MSLLVMQKQSQDFILEQTTTSGLLAKTEYGMDKDKEELKCFLHNHGKGCCAGRCWCPCSSIRPQATGLPLNISQGTGT